MVEIASIKGANIDNAQNAPQGFATWALQNGAIDAVPELEPSPKWTTRTLNLFVARCSSSATAQSGSA
jgi:hypothetical protein